MVAEVGTGYIGQTDERIVNEIVLGRTKGDWIPPNVKSKRFLVLLKDI